MRSSQESQYSDNSYVSEVGPIFFHFYSGQKVYL